MRDKFEPQPSRHEGRYGELSESIAAEAEMLLDILSDQTAEDDETLSQLLETEVHLLCLRPSREVSPDEVFSLTNKLTLFHTALPFSEAERIWLRHIDNQPGSEAVANLEAEIVDQGQRAKISGLALISRWSEWRRQTGAFEHQGTLDLALGSLREVIGIISPRSQQE